MSLKSAPSHSGTGVLHLASRHRMTAVGHFELFCTYARTGSCGHENTKAPEGPLASLPFHPRGRGSR